MKNYALVYPMFAMVGITFAVLVSLFRTRARFVRAGEVNAAYFKTYQGGVEPEASAKLARHFANIFEAPTLFYVACLAAMIAGQATTLVLVLAWAYVALRATHALIHTGANKLNHRIAVYFSSWAVLLLLWICIVAGVSL
ncbi:MAG: MAPEG family protein [Proteobacteria bacterium]|nr:MAPEG family protein [Pseudomonadota bacterium]